MGLDEALRRLDDAANQHILWVMGDILRQRAQRDDWRESVILQQLEAGAPNLIAWNELFRRTRLALAHEDELPRRARTMLRPDNPSFDQALDDFIAEMLAAQYLSFLGHGNIHFHSEDDPITTDLISLHNGISYVTEAKNLREPNSLTYVAFARWRHNRAANLGEFNFTVELLDLEDPFEDLTAAQATAVRDLVDMLPTRERPSTFRTTLPGNRMARVSIREGPGVMLRYGPGPFLVDEAVEECLRTVVIKLLDPTRKALGQLYSTAVPTDYRRLLFVRWKPPDQILAIGEADRVRSTVQHRLQSFIRIFFANFAVAIFHTGEELERTPHADWS